MNLDPESNIIVVEPSAPVRQLLVSVLRSKNIGKPQGVATVKDAVSIMEVETVEWVLTPVMKDQEINALQLVSLLCTERSLAQTRISLFIESSEIDVLGFAYEKGLLCDFNKKFNKESLARDLDEFLDLWNKSNKDPTRTSAFYLRRYLETKKMYASKILFEKAMLNIYPGEADLFLELGKSYFNDGQTDKAKQSFIQYYFLEDKFPEDVQRIIDDLQIDVEKIGKDSENINSELKALPIKKVVVASSGEEKRKEIMQIAKNLGGELVVEYDNGEGAWLGLESSEEPSLMILDWGLDKIPGPVLVQKLKHIFPQMPCIVISDGFELSDRELLKEMGVMAVIKSDASKRDITETIVYAVRQNKHPSEVVTYDLKIRQAIENGDIREAASLKEKMQTLPGVTKGRLKLVEAEFAYYDKNYALARDLAVEAIREEKDTVQILNFLGKCFINLGELDSALKCFNKAQAISPKNIERLCEIAVTESKLKNKEGSDKALDEAKQIDNDSDKIKETQAGINLLDGDVSAAKKVMNQLKSLQNVISFMNNQAVTLARTGRSEDSIKLYEQTLESIPDNKKDMKAIVTYNMAFAYLRMDKLDECLKKMEEAITMPNQRIKAKAERLIAQIKKATESGKSFALASSKIPNEKKAAEAEGEVKEQKEEYKDIIDALAIEAGDLCCFKLFVNDEKISDDVRKLTSKKLRFGRRENIEKSISGGLEKMMKNS